MTRHFPLAVLVALACARAGSAQPADGREPKTPVASAPTPAIEATPPVDNANKENASKDKGKNDTGKKPDSTGKNVDVKDAGKKPEDGDAAAAKPAIAATPADAHAAAAQAAKERDDAVFDPAQPDFTIVNLQTSLRLPKYKSAFRVTHRFTRSLGQGDFGDLLNDFFGFDSGALIGLEYRFGILPGTQIGILRTSDKTIQFFGQREIKAQSASFRVGLSAVAMIDGTNNFRDSYSPALGLIVTRTINKHAAVYIEPIWVNNSNDQPSELVDDNDTFLLGIGARVRIHGGTYLVGEFVPRVAGYDPRTHGGSFGIEKRAGGHSFQVNFSNTFGTTIGQIARGGLSSEDWYIGFNISRKFY